MAHTLRTGPATFALEPLECRDSKHLDVGERDSVVDIVAAVDEAIMELNRNDKKYCKRQQKGEIGQ